MLDSGEAAYQAARVLAVGLTFALALGLERWRPHERLRPAWRANLGLWAVDTVVTAVVCGACGWLVAEWAAAHELGLFNGLALGVGPAIAFSVVSLDAVSYAWHRANHRWPLLWRFHRVHHGDAAFHVTTALRFHPGELLLALPVRLAAVVALGVPPAGVLVFEIVFGTANLLEHGNFELPVRVERAVRRMLVTPTLHRAHHSASWSELDTNFGTVLSVWDRLAGTFRAHQPGRSVATGLPDRAGRPPPGLGGSLLLPFADR